MGIDGIGSKGPPVSPPVAPTAGGPSGAARTGETGRAFEVGRPAPAAPTDVPNATRSALDRLKAGEIDAHGYVEAKVDEATSHLAGLPPAQVDSIRAALRERVASDPMLVDLLRTATGGAAPGALPSSDE